MAGWGFWLIGQEPVLCLLSLHSKKNNKKTSQLLPKTYCSKRKREASQRRAETVVGTGREWLMWPGTVFLHRPRQGWMGFWESGIIPWQGGESNSHICSAQGQVYTWSSLGQWKSSEIPTVTLKSPVTVLFQFPVLLLQIFPEFSSFSRAFPGVPWEKPPLPPSAEILSEIFRAFSAVS